VSRAAVVSLIDSQTIWTTDRFVTHARSDPCLDSNEPMTASPLANLNPEQRRAAEYGGPRYAEAGPLLIIAGAGSGKTNTLAHRVANLITNGVDPRRLMLLTFSRRAAMEMTRRVERIATTCIGPTAAAMTETLIWSGTFHAIGARLLRDYAPQIGLDRSFTIHDRADSEDLMNLVRHDLGFSKTEKRFPAKGTCLAIYSRVVNAKLPVEHVLASAFPWCAIWEAELRQLFTSYVEAKQHQHVLDYDDLLLYWAEMMTQPSIAADIVSRFDHVLVDEYQDTSQQRAPLSILPRNGSQRTCGPIVLRPSGHSL
jgi:DNA helicase-2/ATP-dependent DNA helicase PcrA